MKAYKGFNKNLTCRDYQYEEGKTYEEKEAKLCKSGFHACENPVGKPLKLTVRQSKPTLGINSLTAK